MNSFEIEILKYLNSVFSNHIADSIFVFISTIGNKGAIWIVLAVILLLFKKTRKMGFCAAIALIFCLVVGNGVLKPLIDRIRPFDFDTSLKLIIPPLGDGSFPSGHTMAAFAFSSAVSKYCKKCAPYTYAAASLMAISRIYLMVHYPTDVIAGIVFGMIFGYVAYIITEKVWNKA